MKALKYIPALICLFTMAGCFEDETTVDTVRISEIMIDTLKLQKEYNIDQHEVLLIPTEGVVSETEEQLPLSYEWEVNYKFYSDSSALRYVGKELGSFPVRLKVSNEHGSSFYDFTLNVNSPYERGIAILSANASGEPLLSIMRELSDKEQAAGEKRKFNTNCLAINNPDVDFPLHPTDLAQRDKQLYISFSGTPSVYMLNSKLLNVENIVEDANTDFVPYRLLILDNAGTSAVTLTETSHVYKLATLEGVVLTYPSLASTYDKRVALAIALEYQDAIILWDSKKEDLTYFNHYSPSYAATEGLDFKGHTPIAVYRRDANNFTVLTRKGETFMKTSVHNQWKVWDANYTEQSFGLSDNQVPIAGAPDFTPETPYASCMQYQSLYYAIGNKIYRWYYNTANAFPTTPWFTVDLEGAEITSLSVSPDDKQLYVGVCQPGQPDLNGSLYILDCDTGKNLEESPYLNVAYKPVKVIYKPR